MNCKKVALGTLSFSLPAVLSNFIVYDQTSREIPEALSASLVSGLIGLAFFAYCYRKKRDDPLPVIDAVQNPTPLQGQVHTIAIQKLTPSMGA